MTEKEVMAALATVYDPEIPVDIVELGLIYDVRIDSGRVEVDMTLTNPGCPVAETFPGMVQDAILKVKGVKSAKVTLVWDPPWDPGRMSEEAKLKLGLF